MSDVDSLDGIAEGMEEERSVRNVDKNLLDVFWNLVETAQQVRINAAFSIIRLLHGKQGFFTENGKENVNTLCPELKYSIERLIKGMSSSRKAARQGYALALTEILKLFPAVTIKEVLTLMDKFLPLSNKQEKCQMVIGQLLAYSAIIRSGRLKEDLKSLPTVVLQLYLLSFGRCYIQETTYKLMSHLFSEISEEMFGFVWKQTKKKLSHGWETCTPDLLWFLLLCQRVFPNTVSTEFLQSNWGCKNILSSENFECLQKIVKQSTSAHPQFPPVCSELLHLLLEKKKVKKIWNCVFDEGLFKSDQNERTYLGFKVIKAALSMPSAEKLVSSIVSPNFSSVLTRCLLSNKHPMNSAALELVDFLGKYVKECTDSHVQITILKAFIQPPGTVLMEQMLNKKEVAVIVTNLSSEAVKILYEFLQSVILKASSNDEDHELLVRKQCQAFSQIGTLVSHTAVLADTEWRLQVIKFLFLHSFFEIKEAIEDLDANWIPYCGTEIVSLHPSVRPAGVHSFNRALDSVNRKSADGSTFENPVGLLKSLANFVELLLQSSDKVAPLQPLEKVQESWSSMMETVKKLAKQSKKDNKDVETAAFQIFFLHLGFQLFSDADHIPGILEELQVCCRKALKSRKDSSTEGPSGDPPWVQVMVDLMLSLISQESHHMRCVVNSVFSLINQFITKEALQQILDVINPEEATVEDILAEGSDDENEGDVEFESGSSTDDDDAEEEQKGKRQKSDEHEVNKLRMKVQEALGTAADLSGAESEDMMTDSEMTKLDEALSAAFRFQKKVGHLQFSTEQETLMHFRIRCLDLITIFLKTDPPMSLVLQCILPVLSAYLYGLNKRHQKNFSQKAYTTLQALVKTKKFRDCSGVESDDIRKVLHLLIDKANKETNAPVAKLLSSLCVYMVTCERKLELLSQHAEKKAKKAVEPSCMDQFSTTLGVFINQNHSHLTPHLFVTLMNACPEIAWSFMEPLQDGAFDKNARLFKKSQCLGLLISCLKFSKSQKSVTKEMWLQCFETLVSKAVEALLNMLDRKIKPTYTTELLDLLVTIFEINKEKCSEAFIFKNEEIVIALGGVEKKDLQRKGKKLLNRFIRLLGGGVSIQKPSKRKLKVSEGKENGINENGKKSKLSDDDGEFVKNEGIGTDSSKSTKKKHVSFLIEDQKMNGR